MNLKTAILNDIEYYIIDEIKDKFLYYILINANDNNDIQIRKVVDTEGEVVLETLDDEAEFDRIINIYHDNSKFLPIGTICKLKNGSKKIMITGYLVAADKQAKTYYDYSGCLFPEGVLNPKLNLLFNHDQIEKIYFKGYNNEESKEFLIKIKIAENQMKDLMKKGTSNNKKGE